MHYNIVRHANNILASLPLTVSPPVAAWRHRPRRNQNKRHVSILLVTTMVLGSKISFPFAPRTVESAGAVTASDSLRPWRYIDLLTYLFTPMVGRQGQAPPLS